MAKSRTVASVAQPTGEFFCEYICSAGRWVRTAANVQSGYTCPSFISGCSSEGATRREFPVPVHRGSFHFEDQSTCTYEYRNGRWEPTAACVNPCCPCPTDLEQYSKDNPTLVVAVAHLVFVCRPADCGSEKPPSHGKSKGKTVSSAKQQAGPQETQKKTGGPGKKKR
jgi:hypothetical protein